MKTPLPRLYLGTMTWAWNGQTSSIVDERVALDMAQKFIAHNEAAGETTHRFDTARVYAAGNTEPVVGTVLAALSAPPSAAGGTIVVGTKANPALDGGLSPDGIRKQVKDSLRAMKVETLGEYYLHQPDTEHSLLESLQTCHELITEGTIAAVTLSNYHVSEVARAFELCRQHHLTPPTVYQGLYNPLNRLVEDELLPLLHQNQCSFVAYNPLAAGLLTGVHTSATTVAAGRFKDNPNYLPRFYTEDNLKAVERIRQACAVEKISMVEASYRWLLRHSALRPSVDGILLGASSIAQLDENLAACAAAADQGPLSDPLLEAFDEAWTITRPGAFPYWRSYSSDFPNREQLDPGASYTVKK